MAIYFFEILGRPNPGSKSVYVATYHVDSLIKMHLKMQMWTFAFGALPPAWARIDLGAVVALHPFPTTDEQVSSAQTAPAPELDVPSFNDYRKNANIYTYPAQKYMVY